MRYALRVCMTDRPGMLGALATALGDAAVDIVALDVIDRADAVTVDDLRVEGEVSAQRLTAVCEAVPGVVVEALAAVRAPHVRRTDAGLAADIAETAGSPLQDLVAGLPEALDGSWCVAVEDAGSGIETLAASTGAPPVPAGLRLHFLPLSTARRLPQAQWMPEQWQAGPGDRLEIATAPLHGPLSSVLLARVNGARFRGHELRRLAELCRVAVAAEQRRSPVTAGV